MKATVETPWKGTGTADDPFRPAILDDHPGITWVDEPGSPPRNAASVTQAKIDCDKKKLDEIKANPKYADKVNDAAVDVDK